MNSKSTAIDYYERERLKQIGRRLAMALRDREYRRKTDVRRKGKR